MQRVLCVLIGVVFFGPAAVAAESPAQVVGLQCESLPQPVGIDALRPRLSWRIEDPRRAAAQTAYRVLVASREAVLAEDRGDLWDSGRVESDRSLHVPYQGRPLVSHQVCFWKVRVWDRQANGTAWSRPARWSMGILRGNQWEAKWLQHVEPLKRELPEAGPAAALRLEDAHWIWTGEGNAAEQVPAGTRFFRRVVELPQDGYVQWAYMVIAADDHFRLWVNGRRASESASTPQAWKRALEVELTEKLRPGRNLLAVDASNQRPGPAGLAAKLVVRMNDGRTICLASDDSWKATARPGPGGPFFKPELDDSKWAAASVTGKVGMEPWGVPRVGPALGWSQQASSPVFRKTFPLAKPVARAVVYVAGLGYHELHLNGHKVGDDVLDPAFTRYDRRVLYVAHEVTDLVHQGDNALGVMLGNGWYNMHTRATWDFDQAPWRDRPTLLLHLRIEYADGTTESIRSDATWRATTGPVVLDGIRAGEVYDARREMPGWDTAAFDDSGWAAASVVPGPKGVLSAQMMPPIRVAATIHPTKLTEPRPGVFVFDMGQNFAGWARLRVAGPAGTRVTLRYSERLDARGMIERSEISQFVFEGPFQTDTYVLKGGGLEVWEPRFVYHGFRYVEVTGLPGRPTLKSLDGRAIHTDFAPAGQFACSNAVLNTIQRLTQWSYRNNFCGYPTDCPQREKNGWTGDAHLAAEQAMYNFDNAAAYRKWIRDIADEQRDSGEVSAIVPTSGWGYRWGNGPAWDSALLLIPWYTYLYRGDRRILEANYEPMRRYVDYLSGRAEDSIVKIGLGDWAPAKTKTPNTITSTGYYYTDAMIVARAAEILGHAEEAAKYRALAGKIRQAFNRTFYQGDGVYLNGSQTALSCAIYQGLVAPEEKARVVARLAEKVHQADDHLDVGILGAKYLLHSLSENGHHDLAYRIVTQPTPPGYGDWVARGATTLWENWNGHSSLNHVMFGDVSAWFYQELAGIHADGEQPGFKHTVIRPRPVEDLQWVRAQTRSMYGLVKSAWRREEGGRFVLEVTIPPNTTARVYVPCDAAGRVSEGGRPAAESPGVEPAGGEDGYAVFEVAAGSYRFSAE